MFLAEVDLGEVDWLMVASFVTVNADSPGTLNGIFVYFESDLGPSTNLSTRPARADKNCP